MTISRQLTLLLRDGRSKSLRDTPQREEVVSFLSRARGHVLIEDIVKTLRRRSPRLGRATVFRTLRLLERAGVVNRVTGPDGRRHVELVRGHAHHDHMICMNCGSLQEFSAPAMETHQALAARRARFRVLWHRHELFGYCRACQKKGGLP